jgi:hypothetical protein
MLDKLLTVIQGCGIYQDEDKRIHFQADADIDADGCNGQSGRWAYKTFNDGLENLKNAGYPTTSWYPTILLCDKNDEPILFHGECIASKTAYEWIKYGPRDPRRWVDSFTVPYIVIPPSVRKKAKGIVLGCLCKVTNTLNDQSAPAVCADIGPSNKIGELSMAAAKAIGIDPNPKTGGISDFVIKYELFPDTPAVINGETYNLIPA